MRERDDKTHGLPEAALDDLLAEARGLHLDRMDPPDLPEAAPGDLPPGLSARILADADHMLGARAAEAEAARAGARAPVPERALAGPVMSAGGAAVMGGGPGLGGFWQQLSRAIGGLPALAGLGAVTVAGLWLGLMPPEALQTGLDNAFGVGLESDPYLVDTATAFEFLDSEG